MEENLLKRKSVSFPSSVPSSKRSESDEEVALPCLNSCAVDWSSHPARFVFCERGEWKDFSQETSLALATAFRARHRCAKFTFGGNAYALSFTRKLQLNLDTGFCRSIGWIDVSGKRFIPSRCLEGYGARPLLFSRGPGRRDIDAGRDCRGSLCHENDFPSTCKTVSDFRPSQSSLRVSVSDESMSDANTEPSETSSEELSDNQASDISETSSTVTRLDSTPEITSSLRSTAVSCDALQHAHTFPVLDGKLTSLEPSDPEFEEVKKKFLSGLSVLANHTTISNISKNCHLTASGQMRYEAFRQQECSLKRRRGNANVRYAWYGTSKHGVSSIVLHGFGQPKTPRDGAMYGVGIYLAPEKYSNAGAVYSDVDKNGEQYVVLCRVIMGNMEQVARGSVQFHPGTEDYDNGVDNLCNPRHYIVWSTNMNTYILPEYIVSFKLSAQWQSVIAALKCRQEPRHENSQPKKHVKVDCGKITSQRSPWMSIDILFLLLKSKLSVESMSVLQQQYLDLKDGRLSSPDFVSNLRKIAGDGLVCSTFKSMQIHVLGAVVLRNLLASGQYHLVNGR